MLSITGAYIRHIRCVAQAVLKKQNHNPEPSFRPGVSQSQSRVMLGLLFAVK